MATLPEDPRFDIREQLARIDKMRVERLKLQEVLKKAIADRLDVQQDAKLAPWTVGVAGAGTGAALLAAGSGLAKLLMS